MKQKQLILLTIILISVVCSLIFISIDFSTSDIVKNVTDTSQNSTNTTPVPLNDFPHIVATTGKIQINATVYRNLSYLPIYRGQLREGESINTRFQDSRPLQNFTTTEEAPRIAQKILKSYGGLPQDAESDGAFIQFEKVYNETLKEYVQGQPESTTISYSQKKINGLSIIGDSNYITIELGENGELLRIVKEWKNYSYAGEIPLISLDKAIDKLERYEFIDSDWHPETGEITIDLISLGYFAKKISKNENILEPIWMFYGSNTSTGARLGFYVYARQFANFTTDLETGNSAEGITFRDTSDDSPTRWHWDFGDGTNSTEQNPVHTYEKPGNYTVNLTVWNDLGSDTISRKDLVTVRQG